MELVGNNLEAWKKSHKQIPMIDITSTTTGNGFIRTIRHVAFWDGYFVITWEPIDRGAK